MNDHEIETIFWTFQPTMVHFASKEFDKDTAESLVSDSFVTLWKKNLIFPTTEVEMKRLGALLFTILHGKMKNENRAQVRRFRLQSKLASHKISEPHDYDNTDAALIKITLAGWLAELSPEDQKIVSLFQSQFTSNEIGEILGISAEAARKRRNRLMKRLQHIALNHEEVNS